MILTDFIIAFSQTTMFRYIAVAVAVVTGTTAYVQGAEGFIVQLFYQWMSTIISDYKENSVHVIIEAIAILVILYLLSRPTYNPKEDSKLSRVDEEMLLKQWKPEPLAPEISTPSQKPFIVVSGQTEGMTPIAGIGPCINLASCDFLGLSEHPKFKKKAADAIKKYGVGSCGPRGFYGTIDVHMQLEKEFAEWIGAEDSILYSDGIACTSSVITSFSKRGDLIICDENAHHTIISGIKLSRSNVLYFKHNDMEHLELLLANVQEKDMLHPFKPVNRRFIIVEGIYSKTGDACPLAQVVALKNKYRYRLLLDDSMGVGVLGDTGRGSIEHAGLTCDDVDIVCVSLDTSFASVGGMCAGSAEIVDHQRLSGVGYVFSASSPPYTATAAMQAMKLVNGKLATKARDNAVKMRYLLGGLAHAMLKGTSQLIVLNLDTKTAGKIDQSEFWRRTRYCIVL